MQENALYTENVDKQSPGLTDEDIRFTSKSPVRTVLSLSSCSLLYMMAQNVGDAIDLFWVSKRFGDDGNSTVGLAGLLKTLSLCCTNIVSTATILKVSSLIGLKKRTEAAQVITDLIKFALFIGFLLPAPLYFLAPSILRFASCPEKYISDGQKFTLPIFANIFFSMLYQICCALFMAEGRGITYAICQIVGLVLNVLVFDPLFLFALKWPIWTVGLSFALSQAIPGITLFFIIMKGKFGIKPEWRMFITKPIRESGHALVLALPSFLTVLVGAIPPVFLTSCLLSAAKKQHGNDEIISSVFAASLKVYNIVGAWTIGSMDGMLPCASYSYAQKKYTRVMHLFFAAYSLPFIAHVIANPVMITKPSLILKLWISDAAVEECDRIIPVMYYTYVLQPVFQGCMDLLVATGRSIIALTPQLVRGFGIVGASYALYYASGCNDSRLILFVFDITDVAVTITATLLAIIPFRKLIQGRKEEEEYVSIPSIGYN